MTTCTYVSYLLCGTKADKPDRMCLIHKTEFTGHEIHKRLIYNESWQLCYALYGDETTTKFTAKPSILTSVRSTDHQFFISLIIQQFVATNRNTVLRQTKYLDRSLRDQ
jgi:hypothetical protein